MKKTLWRAICSYIMDTHAGGPNPSPDPKWVNPALTVVIILSPLLWIPIVIWCPILVSYAAAGFAGCLLATAHAYYLP